jgi:hypothetical protein
MHGDDDRGYILIEDSQMWKLIKGFSLILLPILFAILTQLMSFHLTAVCHVRMSSVAYLYAESLIVHASIMVQA